jgi:hypothetical protein
VLIFFLNFEQRWRGTTVFPLSFPIISCPLDKCTVQKMAVHIYIHKKIKQIDQTFIQHFLLSDDGFSQKPKHAASNKLI